MWSFEICLFCHPFYNHLKALNHSLKNNHKLYLQSEKALTLYSITDFHIDITKMSAVMSLSLIESDNVNLTFSLPRPTIFMVFKNSDISLGFWKFQRTYFLLAHSVCQSTITLSQLGSNSFMGFHFGTKILLTIKWFMRTRRFYYLITCALPSDF